MKPIETKEQEISVLTNLCDSDTYFASYFRNDLNLMVSNIRQDFPIELNTEFASKAETVKTYFSNVVKESNKKYMDSIETLLNASITHNDSDLYNECVRCIGISEVIKIKLKSSMELNEKESKFIISKL